MAKQSNFIGLMQSFLMILIATLSVAPAVAGPNNFTYEGILADNNDDPIAGQNANVEISIIDNNATACVLYRETHAVTTDSSGKFVVSIGTFSGNANGAAKYSNASFEDIFSGGSGVTGESSCTSNSGDRKLKISINGVPLTPNLAMTNTPYSLHSNNSDKVSNYASSQLLKATNAGQFSNDLTDPQVTELYALINGTSTTYIKPGSAVFTSQPSYVGAPSTPNDLVNKGYVDTAIVAGLPDIGTAGTYTKVTTDSKGRVSSGTVLAAADIPNLDTSKVTSGMFADSMLATISTPGKVNGSALTGSVSGSLITSGSIGGSTSINTTGNLVTSGDATAPNLYGGSTASGNVLIDSTTHATKGNIIIGPTSGNVSRVAIGTSSPVAGARLTVENSSTSTAGLEFGIISDFIVSPSAPSTAASSGFSSYISTNSNSNISGTISGMQSYASGTGVASYNKLVGVGTTVESSTFGGSIVNAIGNEILVNSYGGGNISNAYGMKISVNNSATVNYAYGIYIGTIGASNPYGVYQTDAANINYFNGDTGIGTNNPGAKLDVNGGLNLKLTNSGVAATIDFSQSNNFKSSVVCDGITTFSMSGMLDGNEYSLYLTPAAHTGPCYFSFAPNTIHFNVTNSSPLSGKPALFKFRKYGSDIIVDYITYNY
jgi:hypothetical protein